MRSTEGAFDAQLSATEIVRRCERRIGELVREGQREGRIAKRGERRNGRTTDDLLTVGDVIAGHQEQVDTYAMSDAPSEQFEQAIADTPDFGVFCMSG